MTDSDRMALVAMDQPPFSILLGIKILSATPDEVVAELPVTLELSNRNGVLHGGAIMSFADNIGGTATMMNLDEGVSTTTVESKTNFLRPIRIGDIARATSIPLHKGRTMMVWQTSITRGDGKLAAVVTQTQLILEWKDKAD